MEKKRTNNTKFKTFLKKNIYYIIMALCVLAIAAMITVTVILNNQNVTPTPPVGNINDPTDPTDPVGPTDPTDPTDPVGPTDPVIPDPTPIVFTSPVASVTIVRDYVVDMLVWHTTLKHYAVNESINFGGEDGTSVMSAYAGTVTSVDYDVLYGYVVTIKHNDQLTTSYGSLNEPSVVVGQTIAKGEIIGTMGNTASKDYLDGAHVTFSLYKNGKLSNPYEYLSIGNK